MSMDKCMGCLGIVFGNRNRKQRLRYKVKYGDNENEGMEFENLFSDDEDKMNYGSSFNFITKEEKDLITKRQYDKIIEQQQAVDEQIQKKTFDDEERVKYEEERFNEAQREASRAAATAMKVKEISRTQPNGKGKQDEYNLFSVGDSDESDDDFEAFLESVKQRSEAFRSDKTSFCDGINSAQSSKTPNNIIISQPKTLSFGDKTNDEDEFVGTLPERDGNADGMSDVSDNSFAFEENLPQKSDNTEWDTFVTGVKDDDINKNTVVKAQSLNKDKENVQVQPISKD